MRNCIVFDIDGTIADNKHRSHYVRDKPKNWPQYKSLLHLDTPFNDIVNIMKLFYETDHIINLCSGREVTEYPDTEKWLKRYNIFHMIKYVYMREERDYRPDDIIKIELIEEMRNDGYEPILWFDDRDRVVKAIREQGIRVLQVAEGNF